jgi:hypothetical protein
MLHLVAAIVVAAVQAASVAPSAPSAPATAPIVLVADERPHPDAGRAPVNGAAPDGAAITGDLSRLRPSERLRGCQQALRAHFRQQMQTGERPWLPANQYSVSRE